jgi:RNA polymerase sigma-70 factor (ECF subfamily)
MGKELEQKQLIDWMTSYQSGNLEAFDSLYRQLKPALFQYLLYKTFNSSLSEDLLQESFLQLHRSRRTYLPGKPVLPWALAIARNVFLMEARSKRRRAMHETGEQPTLPEAATTAGLDRMAEREDLRRAFAKLSSEQREILLMHHVWGLRFGEISGILGILRTTAKLRSHRAIKNLRKILGVSDVTNALKGQNK